MYVNIGRNGIRLSQMNLFLTLSRRRPLSYRNQSINLLCKSMDWFLYDNGLRLERVKRRLHKMVKGTQTIRRYFVGKLFECVGPFCGVGA